MKFGEQSNYAVMVRAPLQMKVYEGEREKEDRCYAGIIWYEVNELYRRRTYVCSRL